MQAWIVFGAMYASACWYEGYQRCKDLPGRNQRRALHARTRAVVVHDRALTGHIPANPKEKP